MPTTKRTEDDDEVLAEQWMSQQGYDLKPPRAEDPYQIRRIMRQCFANGLTTGRIDGVKHPHFTHAELLNVMAYAYKTGGITILAGDVRAMLKVLFSEATFDE